MYTQNSPLNKKSKVKGGGTTKACLPLAKIRSMSKSQKSEVISAKKKRVKPVSIKEILKQMLKVPAQKVVRCVIGLKKKIGDKLLILVKNVEINEIFYKRRRF